MLFGPAVIGFLLDPEAGQALLRARPRVVGSVSLALLILAPAALAAIDAARVRRGWSLRTTYDPTPQAWDRAFRDRPPGFVRVRLRDHGWVGGYFGTASFASSYPEPHDLFIESSIRMKDDGAFEDYVPGTAGVWVRCDDADVIEFVEGQRRERP